MAAPGVGRAWVLTQPWLVLRRYRQYVSALNEGTGAARPLPYVADVGNDAEPVFLGSDVSGRSIRAAHANFLTALNTSPGGAGRRRALKRLTKFTRGDFQAVEPTVPQGATIVRGRRRG